MKKGTLSRDQLETWRYLNREMWVAETTREEDAFTLNKLRDLWDTKTLFMEKCYDAYDLEEDEELDISEVTGNIYYVEE